MQNPKEKIKSELDIEWLKGQYLETISPQQASEAIALIDYYLVDEPSNLPATVDQIR